MIDKRSIKSELSPDAIVQVTRMESLGATIELGDADELYPLESARFYCRISSTKDLSKIFVCYDDDPSQSILRLAERVGL